MLADEATFAFASRSLVLPGRYVLRSRAIRAPRRTQGARECRDISLKTRPSTPNRRNERLIGAEVDLLIGDSAKAKKILDWEPKVRFKELIRIMVDADMELLSLSPLRKHLGKLP